MTDEIPEKLSIKFICAQEDNGSLLVDVIAKNSKISKSLIKKLMVNGSVFQSYKGSKRHARKAKHTVRSGDSIECYYDPKIDLDKTFEFKLLHETPNYGIYHKPVGAMTEGNNYGDKSSLLRHVQKLKKYVYLINRLDREIQGLVVVAYNSKTQNLLQQMWRNGVIKKYQAIVLGELPLSGIFDTEINNKFSQTKFSSIESDGHNTYVEIELATERKNQIRIHFAQNGTPVLNDSIYGRRAKNGQKLKLMSYSLEFIDPQSNKQVKVELPQDRLLF